MPTSPITCAHARTLALHALRDLHTLHTLHTPRPRHTCTLLTSPRVERSTWKTHSSPSRVAEFCAVQMTSVPSTDWTCEGEGGKGRKEERGSRG